MTIVMTTDQNYILQTRVAIWTMLNADEQKHFFNIYILCSHQLEQEKREKIYDLQKDWANVHIFFEEIDENIFRDAKTVFYIPVSSLYRLVISNIIKEDRCLFLDGDIIVNTDLSRIYDSDLRGKYLIGVRDCGVQCSTLYKSHGEIIGISEMAGYVNAGVLLMNLELIRSDDMMPYFLSCMGEHYPMMDQDVLNKCCFGRIGYMDLKYNLFSEYYQRSDEFQNTDFTQAEVEDANREFGILHFSGRYKPWIFTRVRGSSLWWESARKALTPKDYKEIYGIAAENTRRSDWSYVLEKCENAGAIVIIGFSDKGKDVADSLKRCGIQNIKCFCDNSKEKQLSEYNGLTVYSIEDAFERYPKALWVNTSQVYARKINIQLIDMGIENDEIVVYTHKTNQYYNSVDEQYQEYEAEQLALKQYGRKS